jgi:osmoprotectant transport system permease protein
VNLVTETAAWLTNPAQWAGQGGIPNRLTEHILISSISLAVALLLALPAGLAIGHTGRGAGLAAGIANLGRALPSLAVIALAIPFTVVIDPVLGGAILPTLVAMVVLAVPPILVNAYTGIAEVDRDLVEAGRGMGMREREILAGIELPIALPVVLGGVRSAAVQIVATATLGAIFGSGGLGRFLVDGIAQNDDGQVFGGVLLVAGLALATELAVEILQRLVRSPGLDSGAAPTPAGNELVPPVFGV